MSWWNMNEWLYSSDPKWDPDNYSEKIQQIEGKENSFVKKLEALGYVYDDGNDWYERTWSTESEPKESIREVFQQLEKGKWNKLMIGYGDQIFNEEKVSEPT